MPEAQFQLAQMMLSGDGGSANPLQAKKWLNQARKAGHPGAMCTLRLSRGWAATISAVVRRLSEASSERTVTIKLKFLSSRGAHATSNCVARQVVLRCLELSQRVPSRTMKTRHLALACVAISQESSSLCGGTQLCQINAVNFWASPLAQSQSLRPQT